MCVCVCVRVRVRACTPIFIKTSKAINACGSQKMHVVHTPCQQACKHNKNSPPQSPRNCRAQTYRNVCANCSSRDCAEVLITQHATGGGQKHAVRLEGKKKRGRPSTAIFPRCVSNASAVWSKFILDTCLALGCIPSFTEAMQAMTKNGCMEALPLRLWQQAAIMPMLASAVMGAVGAGIPTAISNTAG